MDDRPAIRTDLTSRAAAAAARSEAHPALAPSAPPPRLHTRDFDLFYGTHQALRSVSLAIPDLSVTAIIGPSGCGKSTLLRSFNRMNDLIAGVRTAGTIQVSGTDVMAPGTDVVELRRRVGMVFQRPNPFPKSIFDNVAYGPRILGVSGRNDVEGIVERSLRAAAL